MAYNGSGVFSRVRNWVTDKGNAVPVTASLMDSEMDGFATGLSTAICKDGQQVTTARIPFALGVSSMAGSLAGVSYGQINDLDTGFYFPAAGQWAAVCDGTQVLSVISTLVNVQVPLTVAQTSAFVGNSTFAGTVTASATVAGAYFTGLGAMPVGAIMDFAGSSAPSGWLLCFGQSLVRATYPALFTAIGTTYGAADGTHFTLPDCRGRLTAGKDDMGGSAASRITSAGSSIDGTALGAAGGAQTVTISQANLPVATLTTTITDPGHPHTVGVSNGSLTPGNLGVQGTSAANGTSVTGAAASATTGITASTALGGSGTATNKMPPAIVLNKIIFAGV